MKEQGDSAKIVTVYNCEAHMNILTKLYNLLTMTWNEPKTFGIYHIICVLSIILITVFISGKFKDCSDKTYRRIVGCVWGIIVALEIYKQIFYGLYLEEGKFMWDYAWYAFPFQFCSSPLYILPFIAFSRNEKLRDACAAYMITFSLFAGVAVFCYPNDVFTEMIGINLQTMVHHGSQILIGAFLALRYRDRLNARFFAGGVSVFVIMAFTAMALNIGVYHIFMEVGIDETFNMFFISPYFDCTLPVLSTIHSRVPYAVFICVYFFGFIFCASLVYGAIIGITHCVKKFAKTSTENSVIK